MHTSNYEFELTATYGVFTIQVIKMVSIEAARAFRWR
jgi:hypothetical protein